MSRVSFNTVCSAVRKKFPDCGVISRLYTNTGSLTKCGVVVYMQPGNDRIFHAKNNRELIDIINNA